MLATLCEGEPVKVRAKIVEFNLTTWWGVAQYDLTPVAFHGTSVNGFQGNMDLNGMECDLIFNDSGKLFDVRVGSSR